MKTIILSILAISTITLTWCNQITTQTSSTWSNTSWSATDINTPNAKIASCLKDKWAIFYWTTRCSHCNRQKEMFWDATSLLPFIDCDKESEICTKAEIKWYPTWVFADGTRIEWAQEITTLSEKTWCK